MDISALSLSDDRDTELRVDLYTGASCINNGKNDARAAITICFNGSSELTITELIDDNPMTNQKAELLVIDLALNSITNEKYIDIFSKSKYAVDSINKVVEPLSKKVVANQELIYDIKLLLTELRSNDKFINISHVSNENGNSIAQNLAKQVLKSS